MAQIEDVLNWIQKGGKAAKEPVIDKKDGTTAKINWSDVNEVESLFSGIEDSAGYLRYTSRPPYYQDKTFVKNLGIVLARETKAIFDIDVGSTGDIIATALGFGTEAGNVAGVPAASYSDLWDAQSDETKAQIIYEYYLTAAAKNMLVKNAPVKSADMYTFHINPDETIKSPFNMYFKYWLNGGPTRDYSDKYLVGLSFAQRINAAFFPQEFLLVNMLKEDAIKSKISLIAKRTNNTPSAVVALLKAKNLAKNNQLADDLFEEAEEDSENIDQRKEFFKKIEQCVLLNIVDKLGEYRQHQRSGELRGSFGDRLPYGGRVICIRTEENMYSNYANSDGEIWNYSRNLTQTYLTNTSTSFNFIISKMQTVDTDDGPKEIEMPLLFEGAKNFLYDSDDTSITESTLTGSFKGIKIFTEDKEKTENITVYDLIKRKGSSTNDAIKFENLSIKFHGENQATAKSNVDVELSISIPNLLLFQAQFQSNTFYTKDDGTKVNYPYTYSLVDLITYLHRTDLGDVYKKLAVGGSRLFQPRYFRNYNRLAMKIVALPSDAGLEKDEGYKKIKKHLENNPLILDLALIDHTIEKDAENQEAKIKISYKGYIKSFLQNPKFDIIRDPDQIRNEIALERKLIDDLQNMNDSDAIRTIDIFNKRILDDTLQKTKSVTLFNQLISRGKMFFYKVAASDFVNSISKKYELLSLNTVAQNFKGANIGNVLNFNNGGFTDEIKDKLKSNGDYTLKYFYLGDLIEIMMDNFYEQSSTGNRADNLRKSCEDFPFKVILPNFEPLTTTKNQRKLSGREISVADFPISYEWFTNWYIEEFVESEISFYTFGTLINRLISDVFNGFLNDTCYLQGHHSRKMFATRAEFGVFSKTSFKDNYINKQKNTTEFDIYNLGLLSKGYVPSEMELDKSDAPFFKKDPKIPRNDHCNFLYVYPQIAMFSDFKGIQPNATDWEKYNIPEIQSSLTTRDQTTAQSVYTNTVSYSKEEANYRRESRFQTEKLYSLAQLASVYNITAEVQPSLDIFPGMLVWVNAGFYQNPNVLYSIANILGMGGYHLIESVTHTGEIANNTIEKFKTQITANWISNSSIKLENETPEESKTQQQLITEPGSAADSAKKKNYETELVTFKSGGTFENEIITVPIPKSSIGNRQKTVDGVQFVLVKIKELHELKGSITATIGQKTINLDLEEFKINKKTVWGFRYAKQPADTKWSGEAKISKRIRRVSK